MSFCKAHRGERHGSILAEVFEWDVYSWSRAIDFWESAIQTGLAGKNLLELGARHGGLSLLFALEGAQVVCSDFGGPSQNARILHQRYGVTDTITYRDIDATSIDAPDNSFDYVVFKSVMGGIGRDDNSSAVQLALREISRVLRPGGTLLFAENLAGSTLHAFFRRSFVRWGASWNYLKVSQIKETFDVFEDVTIETWGFVAAFGRNNSQRNALYHLDRLIAPIVPQGSRYIVFGIARNPQTGVPSVSDCLKPELEPNSAT